MAFYDSTDAVFGYGTYGSARYGIVEPVVSLTGVSASVNTRTIHLNVFEVDITEPLYNAEGATSSVGSLTLHTTAGVVGLSNTVSIGTIAPNVNEPVDSVSGTLQINTVTLNVVEPVDSISATATIDTENLVVKSFNTISVSLDEITGFVGNVQVNNSLTLSGVQATGYVSIVEEKPTDKVTGVSATGSIGSVNLSNTYLLSGVSATGQIGDIGGAPSEEITTGVEATASVNTDGVKVNVREIIPSSIFPFVQGNTLGATISVKLVPQTAAQVAAANAANQGEAVNVKIVTDNFDFDAVATQYSRRRTVTVSRAA